MARLPYADTASPQTRELAERITRERGSVLHLYAMLLHSAPVAEGWLRYLTAIRHECALPGLLRELVIMRVAQLNGAPYEAQQHAPIALREGMTQAQIDALGQWPESGLFDETQRAVLAYCDAMTRTVHVPDDVFAAVRAVMDNRNLVELTAAIGAYNMVSRFLEAMQIDARDDMTNGK